MLALIGFALMIILMFALIKEKMAPPLAFILLPLIAGRTGRIRPGGDCRIY